jgi:signal transduction histidine kinase
MSDVQHSLKLPGLITNSVLFILALTFVFSMLKLAEPDDRVGAVLHTQRQETPVSIVSTRPATKAGLPGPQEAEAQHRKAAMFRQSNGQLLQIRQKRQYQRNWLVFLALSNVVLMLLMLGGAYALLHLKSKRYQAILANKNEYIALLEQRSRDLSMVTVIASHDLKAPLRKLSYFMDAILKDSVSQLSPESRELFGRAQACGEKMQALVHSILNIARRPSTEPLQEDVQLSQIARDVISTLSPLIQETRGRVEIGAMCSVQGNKSQMTRLLQNLIENALKYHQPGVPPVVRVFAKSSGQDNCCEIRIIDNGIGMAPEQQQKAFQMFQRLPGSLSCEGSGVGLGSVKSIVESHRGTIHINSRLGKGAEFIVKLPILKKA